MERLQIPFPGVRHRVAGTGNVSVWELEVISVKGLSPVMTEWSWGRFLDELEANFSEEATDPKEK